MNTTLFLFLLAMQFVLFLCVLGLLLYFGYIFLTFRRELPYVPTPYSIIRKMIELANIQPTDRVVDLGSGTGRIVLEVTRRFPVVAIGVERSPLLLFAARLRRLTTRQKGKVLWERADFFTYPLENISVVFCFLVTSVLTRLAPRFASLPSNARIVSYKFRIPLNEEWDEHAVKVGRRDVIYVYTKKR